MGKKRRNLLIGIVRALRRAALRIQAPGRITAGENFIAGPRPRVARGVTIKIGDHVNIGADFVCEANLVVGDNVMISSHVAFIGDDHPFDASEHTIQDFAPRPASTTTLGGDNLIGYGSTIIGPVNIGRGTIVGARSVVTRDLPDNTICYGTPARPRRMRRGIPQRDRDAQ